VTARGLLSALAAAGALVACAAPAEAARRFHGDVAGAVTGPGHSFVVGDGLYLEFRDRTRAHTRYRVCYTRGHGRRCYVRTTGARNRTSRIFFTPRNVGTYKARWYVGGAPVTSWTWYNGIGD
jgi:hypothetical protein